MNLETLLLGIVVGILIGAVVSFLWMNKLMKSKASSNKNTEIELKALLSEKAKNHINTTRLSLEQINKDVAHMLDHIENFEKSLQDSPKINTNDSFFGEHATVFLRNTEIRSDKAAQTSNTDDQPKDFANTGSGVFVGSSLGHQVDKIQKPNN